MFLVRIYLVYVTQTTKEIKMTVTILLIDSTGENSQSIKTSVIPCGIIEYRTKFYVQETFHTTNGVDLFFTFKESTISKFI